jgi:hypothetical protein
VNYKLRIRPEVKQTIASWRLPREVFVQVYAHLHDELAADPDTHLGDIIAPTTARVYYLTAGVHEFAFMIERNDQTGELNVTGCRHDKGSDPVN